MQDVFLACPSKCCLFIVDGFAFIISWAILARQLLIFLDISLKKRIELIHIFSFITSLVIRSHIMYKYK
uniref:Uncharacterized protein n=1 Tax=Pararge aegeria TaxID=116150 RepID=S4NGX2_9NEOP